MQLVPHNLTKQVNCLISKEATNKWEEGQEVKNTKYLKLSIFEFVHICFNAINDIISNYTQPLTNSAYTQHIQ